MWDTQGYKSRESAWTYDGRAVAWRQDWNREGYHWKHLGYICKPVVEHVDIFLSTKDVPAKGSSHIFLGFLIIFCPPISAMN